MTPLPVLSCEGCGKCCEHLGSPPFAYPHPSLMVGEVPEGWGDGDPETLRHATMPPEALAILQEYYRELDTGMYGSRDRGDLGLPCLWYDTEKKQCRFYEHRPEVCREFEMGGEECLATRADATRPPSPVD